MSKEFIEAVRALVEAVLTEHCLPADAFEAEMNMEYSINCALTVLRKISATAEFSSLHAWANKRLEDHAGSEDLWTRFYSED